MNMFDESYIFELTDFVYIHTCILVMFSSSFMWDLHLWYMLKSLLRALVVVRFDMSFFCILVRTRVYSVGKSFPIQPLFNICPPQGDSGASCLDNNFRRSEII